MKKVFLEPELAVVKFGEEDIITTSVANDGSTDIEIGGGIEDGGSGDPFGQ